MKHIRNLSCVLALLCSVPALASEPQHKKDFESANERALSGDFKGAISLYEHLISEGVRNADVYYNLGNARASSGKLVEAVVAYERALRISPNDSDARANLATIRNKLRPENAEAGPQDAAVPADWVEPLVAPMPANLFAVLAILANAALFGFFALRRRTDSEKLKRWSIAGWTASLVLLCVSGLIVLGHVVLEQDVRAVARSTTVLKAGPDARFSETDRVRGGDRLHVLGEDGKWLHIKSADGRTGWIQKSDAEMI